MLLCTLQRMLAFQPFIACSFLYSLQGFGLARLKSHVDAMQFHSSAPPALPRRSAAPAMGFFGPGPLQCYDARLFGCSSCQALCLSGPQPPSARRVAATSASSRLGLSMLGPLRHSTRPFLALGRSGSLSLQRLVTAPLGLPLRFRLLHLITCLVAPAFDHSGDLSLRYLVSSTFSGNRPRRARPPSPQHRRSGARAWRLAAPPLNAP